MTCPVGRTASLFPPGSPGFHLGGFFVLFPTGVLHSRNCVPHSFPCMLFPFVYPHFSVNITNREFLKLFLSSNFGGVCFVWFWLFSSTTAHGDRLRAGNFPESPPSAMFLEDSISRGIFLIRPFCPTCSGWAVRLWVSVCAVCPCSCGLVYVCVQVCMGKCALHMEGRGQW